MLFADIDEIIDGTEKLKTHGDVIRSMSDEQLAEYVGKICLCSHIQDNDRKFCDSRAVCTNCIAEWLKHPAEGE